MPTYVINFKKPVSKRTIQRIKEVQFYLFLESMVYKYSRGNQQIIDIVESLATMFGCRPTMINSLIDYFKNPAYKPDYTELSIACFILGIPVRQTIQITGIGNGTYYKHLEAYIKKGEYDLVPRFNPEQHEEMSKFLKQAKRMFNTVTHTLKGNDIYDEYQI